MMNTKTRAVAILLAVACFLTASRATAVPAVNVAVDRSERKKVIGLAEQLEKLQPAQGDLRVSDANQAGNKEPASDEWQVVFRWSSTKPPKLPAEDGEKAKPDPRPTVATTAADTETVRKLLTGAVGDSFGDPAGADWQIATLPDSKARCVEIEFPGPQTGVSKARQFRVARRFVSALMSEGGMTPPDKPFTAGLFDGRVLCNYDAEGVGYEGSTLLDRAIDETDLDARTLPVCPEDIREGVLDGAAGVLFPGGSGKAIAKALRPEGIEKVREFVAAGGGYYGVCAGAYFANSGLTEYAGLLPIKHSQPWRRGKGMLKLSLTEKGKQLLGAEFAEFETRYNCGPVYKAMADPVPGSPQQPVEVLANFASAATDKDGVTHEDMVGTPAIISGGWGKGRVITVSPHPESHTQLSVLVARAIALSLGVDPAPIKALPIESAKKS